MEGTAPAAGPVRLSIGGSAALGVCLVAAALLALGARLGAGGLLDIRERRIAATARDILRSGRWVLPSLQDHPRLEKPPLAPWAVAAAVRLTGQTDETAVRLPGALAGLVLIAAVVALGADRRRPVDGPLAGLFLASMLGFITEFRQASCDTLLALWVTGAILAWWRAGQRWRRGRSAGFWPVAAGISLGLGLLSKGPVALIPVGAAVAGGWRGMAPETAGPAARFRSLALMIAVAAAVGLAWPVAVWRTQPRAIAVWWEEMAMIVRADADGAGRPAWYYLTQMPAMTLPWTVLALGGLLPGRGDRRTRLDVGGTRGVPGCPQPVPGAALPAPAGGDADRAPLQTLVRAWFIGPLVVFSGFGARKAYYLLPALPALALAAGLMAGGLIDRIHAGRPSRIDRWWVGLQAVAIGLTGGGAVWGCWVNWPAARWAAVPAALALAGAAVMMLRGRDQARGMIRGSMVTALVLAGIGAGVYGGLLPQRDPLLSHRGFAAAVRRAAAGRPVYSWGPVDPAFWFYLPEAPRPIDRPTLARLRAAGRDVLVILPAISRQRWPAWLGPAEQIGRESVYADRRYRTVLVRCRLRPQGARASRAAEGLEEATAEVAQRSQRLRPKETGPPPDGHSRYSETRPPGEVPGTLPDPCFSRKGAP